MLVANERMQQTLVFTVIARGKTKGSETHVFNSKTKILLQAKCFDFVPTQPILLIFIVLTVT